MRSVNKSHTLLRDAIAKTVRMLASSGIKVSQMGAKAYCEFDVQGRVKRINIPMIPEQPSKEFIDALQGFVDHEVAHALFTDGKLLSDDVKERSRRGEWQGKDDPISSMINIVEDVRIEAASMKQFPGAEVNLEATQQFIADTIWHKWTKDIQASAMTDEEKASALAGINLVPYLRAKGGQRICARYLTDNDLWDKFKAIDMEMPDLDKRLQAMHSTGCAQKLAKEIYEVIKSKAPPPPPSQSQPSDKQDKKEKSEKSDKSEKSEQSGKPDKSDQKPDDKKEKSDDKGGEGASGEEDEEEEDAEDEKEAGGKSEDAAEEDEKNEEGSKPDTDKDAAEEGDDADSEDESEEKGHDGGKDDAEDDAEDEEEGEDGSEADDGDDEGDNENDGAGNAGSDDTGDSSGYDEPEAGEQDAETGDGEEEKEIFITVDMNMAKDADSSLEAIIQVMLDGAFKSEGQVDFSRDFDRVEKYVPDCETDVRVLEEMVRTLAGPLQTELQRLMVARAQSHFVPGHRSGRINASSLHRLKANDDRVFRRKHEAQTNAVAVSLLVDLSGSMRGEKVRTALTSAWAFSEVLDRLKIKNEVSGFTSYGDNIMKVSPQIAAEVREFISVAGLASNQVRLQQFWMPIFKSYEERFTQEVKRRLSHMAEHQQGMRMNNDALAIDYAGQRLAVRPEPRKVMIVLSDGAPADGTVSPGYVINSMKANLAKLQKQGVETIGIGINDDNVKKFYPRNMVIHSPSELPGVVTKELKALLLN